MNIENQTILEPVDLGNQVNPLLPVTSYAATLVNSKCSTSHAHVRAQLIYADKGIMRVVTPKGIWIVNPLQAIWVPGMIEHQVYFPNHVHIKNLFVDPSKTALLPIQCFAFDVSSFIKELILKIIGFNNELMTPREERIIEVLCDELKLIKPSALFLPTSNHDKLKQVIDALLNDIADTRTLAELADLVCVSPRTLTRLFVNELGMNFNEWRTRLKVLEAIRRLHEKQPVTEIAIDLGYESSSAFIHMFRKYVGKTPAQYLGE